MARPQVYDTSAVILAIRSVRAHRELVRQLATGTAWLSAVTLAELYAGCRSRAEAAVLDRIAAALEAAGRLLVPASREWIQSGQLIARYSRLHGEVRPRDHLADVLITLSAARIGAAVVTANVAHFQTWTRLARRAGLDVTIRPFPGE